MMKHILTACAVLIALTGSAQNASAVPIVDFGSVGAQGTVCGGGRYDGLFEQLGGKPTPACAWAMDIERLLAPMAESRGAK